MKKTKTITPAEYSKWKGCTIQNVTKHLRNGNSLPDVVKVHKYSRFYLLEVNSTMK